MDQYGSQAVELDLKDILLFLLKKAFVILLAGLLATVFFLGYKYVKGAKAASESAADANILDVSVRLSGESDTEYDKRVQLVSRAQTIMDSIESMNIQSDNLNNYISNSLLMQLDPMNVSVSEAQFVIKSDDGMSNGINDALLDSYADLVCSGSFISVIADEYGYDVSALQELINIDGSFDSKPDNSIVISTDGSAVGVLTIRIWGGSAELTEVLLDGAIDEIYNNYSSFESSIAKHSITEIGRRNYTSFVLDVRDSQLKTMTTYQTLQSQIDSGNKYLDDIAKQLGLSDRNSFYADTALNVSSVETNSLSLKNVAVGFVIGVVLAVCFYVCRYFFGRKIYTQSQFFCLFPSCRKIGVLKPSGKRSSFIASIDRISGDDTDVVEDKVYALTSANCINMIKDRKSILVTGSINEETANRVVKCLGLSCDVKVDIFNNPKILKSLSNYDGVIMIEQRGFSEKRIVRRELELLQNGANEIIGAIIV